MANKKGRKQTKNAAMLVVRNQTKQEVTNVIFPNGLQVGVDDVKFQRGMKVHGNTQVIGTLNATEVRQGGVAITTTGGVVFTLSPPAIFLPSTNAYVATIASTAFAEISCRRGASTVANAGTNSGAPTGDDTFNLDIDATGEVTGTSTNSSGTTRSLTSSYSTGTLTIKDAATSGTICVITVSDTGNNAKLLVTSLSTLDGAGGSSYLSHIDINIPVDAMISRSEITATIPLRIQKVIAGDTGPPTPSVNFTRSIIPVDTDSTGGAIDDGNDLADADISEQAFTKIDVNVGATNVTFAGHNESGDPSSNTYKIVSDDITAVTDNGTSLTESQSASEGDTSYNITFANSGTRLTLAVSSDSSDAKFKVSSLAEHEDGSSTDFNSIQVFVPIKATTAAGTQTFTRSFTVQKVKNGAAGTSGTAGADAWNVYATASGTITSQNVTSAGAVTNNAADFLYIKGHRASTTIQYNGNTAGTEGTTNDRFALDVESNDKVVGHSYDTSGNERDVHSTWNSSSSLIELRDNSTSGAIIAKLTPSAPGSGAGHAAKLLLTDFATDQRGATSNTLQSIHVEVTTDVRVNGATEDDHMISITLAKNIPGATGSTGASGSSSIMRIKPASSGAFIPTGAMNSAATATGNWCNLATSVIDQGSDFDMDDIYDTTSATGGVVRKNTDGTNDCIKTTSDQSMTRVTAEITLVWGDASAEVGADTTISGTANIVRITAAQSTAGTAGAGTIIKSVEFTGTYAEGATSCGSATVNGATATIGSKAIQIPASLLTFDDVSTTSSGTYYAVRVIATPSRSFSAATGGSIDSPSITMGSGTNDHLQAERLV